ncbi:dTDP-4-dehydrorhamnose reductase [Kistimonas scapharcae]|uniref:dTDP-4-dehydrorhamnose reductase n=1 Tax=Kistimonas scapharcae TaxID=1036133 RepID=A0ABP8V981_9GAMM
MRILITGANGMLGSVLSKKLKGHEVFAYSRAELDITNRVEIKHTLKDIDPQVIIHAAAYTNVEQSEVDPDKAYLVNVIGTQNLVDACVGNNVLFVYISSTGIYGTKKVNSPYNEFDEALPTTIHHKSKLEAEKVVINHLNKFLIIRTGWLFGGSIQKEKNFVFKRYLEASSKKKIYSDPNQIGNPTYVEDLVDQINLLIDKQHYGIFNCVNNAVNVTRLDYVQKIISLFELDCQVEAAPKGIFKRVAPVSSNESAENKKLDFLGVNIMGDWQESLQRYVKLVRSKEV